MMHFKPTQFDIWSLKRKVILVGRGISGRWRREESGVQVEPLPVLASVSYNTCLNPPPAHAKCLPSPDRHLISEREKTAPSPAPLISHPARIIPATLTGFVYFVLCNKNMETICKPAVKIDLVLSSLNHSIFFMSL